MRGPVVEHIPPTRWWKQSNWRLSEPYLSRSLYLVPKGFISDGATIPLPVRWLFSPTGSYFGAALVHDHSLVKRNWREANRDMRLELEASKVPKWQAVTLMAVVIPYQFIANEIVRPFGRCIRRLYERIRHL